MLLAFLAIDLPLGPEIVRLFGQPITWHGFFTAAGIIVGVLVASRVATSVRVGIDPDTVYTLGLLVVGAGVVGARALYVIENYGDPGSGLHSPIDVLRLNEGGISIYGAIIGGALAGWAYGLLKRLPAAAGADAAAFGMMAGLAVGRIGDIINGEHYAKTTDLPWAVTYSHPDSPGLGHGAMHPAVAYEMLGDLVILGVLALVWRRQPKPGVVFALSFLLYAVMRFFVSFLRIDSEEPLFGLSTPQLVSLVVIPIAAALLVSFSQRRQAATEERQQAPWRSGDEGGDSE